MYVKKRGSRSGVIAGHLGFLSGDIDDRVIHDIINYVLLPQGRYSENFMMISQQEVSQEGGYLEDIEGS